MGITTSADRGTLVIGASRGIGRELVRQAIAAGETVTATARSAPALAQLAVDGARAIEADVALESGCTALAAAIEAQRFGTIWLVAGVLPRSTQPPEPPSLEEFDRAMHTNVLAAMRLAGPLTRALASGGRLAAISSKMGSIGGRSNGSAWTYRASKAALNSVIRDIAFTLGEREIAVALHPGWVRTDMGGAHADLTAEQSARDLRSTVARLTPASSGAFLDHDGTPIAY